LDQHGFLQMQFTNVSEPGMPPMPQTSELGSLADFYGHISCRDRHERGRAQSANPYVTASAVLYFAVAVHGSLDEAGYYCVDGMAIMSAQARSLGFSLV
jgi:hypothetical protein